MDDVTKAAERLRGITEPTFYTIRGKRCIPEADYIAAVTLAMAWLAEHSADDGEPVTELWLRSMGAAETKLEGGSFKYRTTVGFEMSVTFLKFRDGWECVQLNAPVRTRGDVRRLCRALGVELKESA